MAAGGAAGKEGRGCAAVAALDLQAQIRGEGAGDVVVAAGGVVVVGRPGAWGWCAGYRFCCWPAGGGQGCAAAGAEVRQGEGQGCTPAERKRRLGREHGLVVEEGVRHAGGERGRGGVRAPANLDAARAKVGSRNAAHTEEELGVCGDQGDGGWEVEEEGKDYV